MVNGKEAPTIGNICMDACMIDVTGIDCEVGDSVEIFGQNLPVQRLADILDTIQMESDACDIDQLSDYTTRALELLKFCKERLFKTNEEVEKCLAELREALPDHILKILKFCGRFFRNLHTRFLKPVSEHSHSLAFRGITS